MRTALQNSPDSSEHEAVGEVKRMAGLSAKKCVANALQII